MRMRSEMGNGRHRVSVTPCFRSLNMLMPFDYGICWRSPRRRSGGAVFIEGVGPAHPGPSALQAELSSAGAPGKVVRQGLGKRRFIQRGS